MYARTLLCIVMAIAIGTASFSPESLARDYTVADFMNTDESLRAGVFLGILMMIRIFALNDKNEIAVAIQDCMKQKGLTAHSLRSIIEGHFINNKKASSTEITEAIGLSIVQICN